MNIHIGEKIKERAHALRIGPTEFARRINTTKQNIGWIYKRASLDSLLLFEISKALELNFFSFYDLSSVENPKADAIKKELDAVKKDNAMLQKELELVKENNQLLKALHGKEKKSKAGNKKGS
jgi:hypothetical protein